MGCFNQAILVILKHEGGFANHSADPGGATNFGISLRWLKSQGLYGDIDDDGDVDIDDIKALDIGLAKRIYRDRWWDKYMYDRIVGCKLATKIFDTTINTGASRSHKILQRAVNALGGKRLSVDGVMGPNTIAATNSHNADALLGEFRKEQERFYLRLIRNKPDLVVFKNGWINRARA